MRLIAEAIDPPEMPLARSVTQQRTDLMVVEGNFVWTAERRREVPRSLGMESYYQYF
jgi:hypothetical protein